MSLAIALSYLILKLFAFLFTISLIYCLFEWLYNEYKSKSVLSKLAGKNVLITGGSEGIGKSMAKICYQQGADLILLARNPKKLNDTKNEILACDPIVKLKQKVKCFSVDVTDQKQVDKTIDFIVTNLRPIDILINCAGKAIAETALNTPVETFEQMMNVNYFGTVNMCKSLCKHMIDKQSGHIVIVSSIAGLFGMFGYSAYSAAKFALIGFAQSLQMELKNNNVSITVVLPPDTDTPGFEQEQISKPLETRLISESGGLLKPEVVAEKSLKDVLMNKFVSTVGLENNLVRIAGGGCFPVQSLGQLFLESLMIGPCKILFGLFNIHCQRLIQKCAKNNLKQD